MLARLVVSTILPIALMQGPALAQGTKDSVSDKNPNANQSAQSLPTEIKQKLEGQGFTNVQVVPGSLLVSAKDKDGDPVTMIIGPHSMTVFTVMSSDGRSTTGSGGQSQSK